MIEPNITAIRDYLLSLQEHICQQLEIIDSKESFVEDAWERSDGLAGGGRTRVLNNGNVIEQGGVNFSHVRGTSMPASATANRPDLAGRSFEAIGYGDEPQYAYIYAINLYECKTKMKEQYGDLSLIMEDNSQFNYI